MDTELLCRPSDRVHRAHSVAYKRTGARRSPMESVAIPMATAADGESTGSPLSTSPISGALKISTVVPASAAPSLHRLSRSPVMNADGQMFKSTDEQNEVAESEPEPEPEQPDPFHQKTRSPPSDHL